MEERGYIWMHMWYICTHMKDLWIHMKSGGEPVGPYESIWSTYECIWEHMCTYVYGMCMNDPNCGERVHTWGCFRQYSMRGVRWYRWYVKRRTEFTWVCGGAPLQPLQSNHLHFLHIHKGTVSHFQLPEMNKREQTQFRERRSITC